MPAIRRWPTCPRPTARPAGRSRSAGGCTGSARRSSTGSGFYRLLALIPDGTELRGFVDECSARWPTRPTEAADLRATLQVLLDTNFNVAEAARLQFFHYNTMRYRVAKLERLLGPFTTDPHLRLDVASRCGSCRCAASDPSRSRASAYRTVVPVARTGIRLSSC